MGWADRPWGRTTAVDVVEADQHLDRFLLWLTLASLAFGTTVIASSSVFSSARTAIAGAGVVAVAPLAVAGRRAAQAGEQSLALVLARVPLIASATAGVFLLYQVDVVVPVAIIVVLIALPIVRARTLSLIFAGVLAWIGTMTVLGRESTPPSVPEWFMHAVSVTSLTVTTALAMFLIRNLRERWTDLARSIRAAEAQYRTLVEQLPAITFVDEVEDAEPFAIHPLYVSPQVESILGYAPERWVAEPNLWRSILHPDDRDLAIELADQIYETREPYTLEYRLVAADGRIVWI